MEVAKRVAKNTLYKTATLVVGNISGLFLAIALARILKPEQFGIYSLALSICMLAIALANLGVDGAVVRYTAFHIGKDNLKKVRGHFRYFLRVKLILSLAVSVVLVVLSGHLASFFGDERLTLLLVFAGFVVFSASLTNFFKAFFRGLQDFKYNFVGQTIYEFSRWLFVLPLAYVFLSVGALFGYILAYVISFMVLLVILVRKYGDFVFGKAEKADEKVVTFMGFMTIARISGIIYVYVDSIMIGYLLTTTDVGYYRAAYTIVFAIVGLLTMADVLLPVFTQLDGRDLKNAINRIAKYTSAIAFPAAFGLAYLSPGVIKVVYGAEYLSASLPLSILSLVLIPASFNYLLTIFNAKERPEYSAYIISVSMLLNVVLNYVLIKLVGISGAALATSISRAFTIMFAVYLLYRVFDLKVPAKVYFKPMVCSLLMLFLLTLLPIPGSLVTSILEIAIAVLFYFTILFAVKGLSMEDIRYLINLFKS